jgi:endonuclease YncB( thermonuclease family)
VALSLALESAQAAEWFLEGHMVDVSDGDTITVLDDAKAQHKVRFAGIDSPESGQAFGARSEQNLSAVVFRNRVEARYHKRDRSGSQACAVFVGLRDVGFEQICASMAWWYREYPREQRTRSLPGRRGKHQGAARRVAEGAKPVPPWEWREVR